MGAQAGILLSDIQRDALDSGVPLSDTLRKLIALGGESGSVELREWASRELRGYVGSDVELPGYRKVGAVIKVDAVTGNMQIRGQQWSPRDFPEGIRDHIGESVPLGQGVGEIEALAAEAAKRGSINLTLPEAATVARLIDHEVGDPFQHIMAIYWDVSAPAIAGALDAIRTTLVELVAEMRASTPSSEAPSRAAADNAVNVVVHGNKPRISVNASQASGALPTAHVRTPSGRTWWRILGAAIVGVATIGAMFIALAQWQGWG